MTLVGNITLTGTALETIALVALALACALIVVVWRRQARELHDMAHTDPLTGLVNHRGFHEALAAELARAQRDGTQLSLVNVDLDDFKTINDTHGHPYGDEVLRGIGTQLRGSVRQGDTAARVGGEEFALILPGTSSDAAYEIGATDPELPALLPSERGRRSPGSRSISSSFPPRRG